MKLARGIDTRSRRASARSWAAISPWWGRLAMPVAMLVFALCALTGARSASGHEATAGDHAKHHQHLVAPDTRRAMVDYHVPDVTLVRDDGKSVKLADELADGRPVVLAFIYTTCTTVCPVTSQSMSQLQARLGPMREHVHLVSISIDPEHDTPARLREYARQFGAGPAWQHYTGTLAASQTVQRAFDVYRGNKMDHAPAVLVRSAPSAQWVRLNGFPTADQVLAELPALHASR
jgi:protein SCO1/2